VSGLLVAVRYLTILPVPGRARGGPEVLGRAAAWFPVVGLALGAGLVVVDRATAWLFPTLLASLLVVTAWKLATGGLHLDGLADCLDGLVGHDAAHRLAIMRDSRIGAFGAVGLILFLFLEVESLAELASADRWRALLVAPVVGRSAAPLVARLHRPARADGHGAAFLAGVRARGVVAALGLTAATAAIVLGVAGVAAAAVGVVAATALAGFLARRLGGVTGDVLGAAVEVAEVAVLLTVAAWTHVRP
jgi:adenosylcobinamide-GDP ribazoletransferase